MVQCLSILLDFGPLPLRPIICNALSINTKAKKSRERVPFPCQLFIDFSPSPLSLSSHALSFDSHAFKPFLTTGKKLNGRPQALHRDRHGNSPFGVGEFRRERHGVDGEGNMSSGFGVWVLGCGFKVLEKQLA